MADDWTARLKRAKWRDFEFLTDSHDSQHGQRLVVTELPGADEPIVEDLGGKAPSYKVAAYFIGADYDIARDEFLKLLAKPGAEWLTHPWLGRMRVRAHTWGVHESTDKGGYCAVTVDFAPAGQETQVPSADVADTAAGAIGAFAKSVERNPLEMLQGQVNAFVAKAQAGLDVVRNAVARARMPLTWAQQVLGVVTSAKALLGEVMAMPGQYVAMMRNVATALSNAPAGATGGDVMMTDAARVRLVSALTRCATQAARESVDEYRATALRESLKADVVMRSGMLTAAAMQVALADYSSAQARDVVVVQVLATLEVLMPILPDDAYEKAATARAALLTALDAQQLHGSVRDVATAMPAVVLAYELGMDEDVLIERNAVRHPLFVRGRVYG
jgi:prophage DNA circulation protein